MAEREHSGSEHAAVGEAGEAGAPPPGASRSLHALSFKLRFAAQREPGRSYVSLVKPLGLPATVTDKFYARAGGDADEAGTSRALRRIEDMFHRGPRDKYDAPRTSSQVVGWSAQGAAPPDRSDRRVNHHIRDSAWLKARLRVLAADDRLKQR